MNCMSACFSIFVLDSYSVKNLSLHPFLKIAKHRAMSTEYELQNEMLVYGYVKRESKDFAEIPLDIINICLLFYMELFEILTFSTEFISDDGIELMDNNKCVMRCDDRGMIWHTYAMADIEPVSEGVHCWRIKVQNPIKDWIMIGIGHKRCYDDFSFTEGMDFYQHALY